MRLYSLNTVALVLVVLGLVVPTGAVMTDGQDQVWEDEGIVLSPHDGPNGQYASIGDDGNLSVDLNSGNSLNPDAVTTIDGVFDVKNGGDETRLVWITHDSAEHVRFYASGDDTIEGSDNAVELEPGQTMVVGLVVDTQDVAVGTQLLDSLTLHARRPSTTTTTTTTTTTDGVAGGGGIPVGANETPTPTETPTTTEAPPDEEVIEIDFAAEVEGADATVTELDGPPAEQDRGAPKATIVRGRCGCLPPEETLPPNARGKAETLATVDEEITLSGAQSTVGSVEAADRGRRVVKTVDIAVPPEVEDEPATIRMTVRRDRFAGADLSRARVARLTEDGWQLLPTRLERESQTSVTYLARTPGFSVFAVLATHDVTYNWELEGKGTFAGEELNVSWEEPGIYNATLTITDALGRSSSRTYRVLVNDEPTVSIERAAVIEPRQPTTLRANVTDEFGNVSIRWLFEDGTTATGPSVTRSFERGEHDVRVTVEDEYGATGETRTTLVVGQPTTTPGIEVVRYALGFEGRLVLVAGLALALLALGRRVFGRRRR